jgi:hypothetical protein
VAISINAINVKEKKSNGPKRVDQLAIGSASNTRKMLEMTPPTNEADTPNPNARPGWPPTAMGYPSKVVIMDAGVPGIRNKVAEINPPLIDPTYMETNNTIASAGFCMEKVNGNVSAINMAPVSPGIAPTTIPSETPSTIKKQGQGVARFSNAGNKFCSVVAITIPGSKPQ